jgi:hypothetical protein
VNGKPITIPKFTRGNLPPPSPRFTRGNLPPAPKSEPAPEVISEPEPSFAQSRSNGYIRIRLQGAPAEPERPFISPPSRARLMAGH